MPRGTAPQATGQIADNVVGFARALRAAGLPIGPGAVIDALKAMRLIDIGNRADLFTTLESIFVKRHEHALVFAQAFDLFFRRAEGTEHMLDSVPLPPEAQKPPPPAARRVQEAFAQGRNSDAPEIEEKNVQLSVSDREVLQRKDFAQMSTEEIAEVSRAIAQLKLPQAELRTRARRHRRARPSGSTCGAPCAAQPATPAENVKFQRLGRIERRRRRSCA